MCKCYKYLSNLIQTFTDIRASKVMNLCQNTTIYLNKNRNYVTVVTVEPGTGIT